MLHWFATKPHPVDKRTRSVVSVSCISVPRDTNLADRSLAKYSSPNAANTGACRTVRSLTSFTILLSVPNWHTARHCHLSSAPRPHGPDVWAVSIRWLIRSRHRSFNGRMGHSRFFDSRNRVLPPPGARVHIPNAELLQQGRAELLVSLKGGKIFFCCEENPELARFSILHQLQQGLQIVDKDSVNPTTFFPVSRPY